MTSKSILGPKKNRAAREHQWEPHRQVSPAVVEAPRENLVKAALRHHRNVALQQALRLWQARAAPP